MPHLKKRKRRGGDAEDRALSQHEHNEDRSISHDDNPRARKAIYG